MALSISDDQLTTEIPTLATDIVPSVGRRSPMPRLVFALGVTVTAALFGIGAWQRRWIADDGLIVLRTVRNLLAGNGPVFNKGERVETNTSAAWTFLIYFCTKITRARPEYVVLTLALVLSIGAIVLAMLATARLRGGSGATLLIPAGVVVYIALPPARDFATSGLETSLTIAWLGLLWWLLVRWACTSPGLPTVTALAFVAGLGWLVRPETLVLSVIVLTLLFCSPLPSARVNPWFQRFGLALVAFLLPLGYELWRMAYYGLPYPNTAVSKEATGTDWGQGLFYLWNTVGPYWLWFPLVVAVIAGLLLRRPGWRAALWSVRIEYRSSGWREQIRRPRTVVGMMLIAGVFLLVYMLRIGGDFMHGRMMLPPLFCLLAPVSVVPVRLYRGVRGWLVPLLGTAIVVAWGGVVANLQPNTNKITRTGIVDERSFFVTLSGHSNPIRAEDYLDYSGGWMRAMIKDIAATPGGALLLPSPEYTFWFEVLPRLPLPPGGAGHTVYFLNLGMTSMNVPLGVRVIDQEGLAYPPAAHTFGLADGRIGHDKELPPDWVVADTDMVDTHPGLPGFLNADWVREARVALTCPETRDLINSYRGPLTLGRRLRNLTHAFHYAKYRYDRVPQYALEECHLPEPPLEVPRDN